MIEVIFKNASHDYYDVLILITSFFAMIGTIATAIVTYFAWRSQHKLNLLTLSKEQLDCDNQSLEEFRNNIIPNSERWNDGSKMYWFLYEADYWNYKKTLYPIDLVNETQIYELVQCKEYTHNGELRNMVAKSLYEYKILNECLRQSFTSHQDGYLYDRNIRNYRLNEELMQNFGSKKFGIITKKFYFTVGEITLSNIQEYYEAILIKGNQNTEYRNKNGNLCSSGQSFEIWQLSDDKLEDLFLKNINAISGLVSSFVNLLDYVDIRIKNKMIKREALRYLFEQEFLWENLYIIRKVFEFKSKNPYFHNSAQKNAYFIFSETIDKYDALKNVEKQFDRLEELWQKLFGLNCFISSTPSFRLI